jgi:hypothetical protein
MKVYPGRFYPRICSENVQYVRTRQQFSGRIDSLNKNTGKLLILSFKELASIYAMMLLLFRLLIVDGLL